MFQQILIGMFHHEEYFLWRDSPEGCNIYDTTTVNQKSAFKVNLKYLMHKDNAF